MMAEIYFFSEMAMFNTNSIFFVVRSSLNGIKDTFFAGLFSRNFNKQAHWRDGRVVDCVGLENRSTGNGTVGSNPSLSAKNSKVPLSTNAFCVKTFVATRCK